MAQLPQIGLQADQHQRCGESVASTLTSYHRSLTDKLAPTFSRLQDAQRVRLANFPVDFVTAWYRLLPLSTNCIRVLSFDSFAKLVLSASVMRMLTAFDEVTDALGGAKELARITGTGPSSHATWRKYRRFPTRYYLVMRCALEDRGYYAPISLWGFYTELGKAA
jgi:hypothetical protein